MAKTTKIDAISDVAGSGLPAPFSLEDFRTDVTNVFLHYVRNISWMAGPETAWAITKAPMLDYIWSLHDPDCAAADLGLNYDHIRDTEFALAMERMYEYAYFGKLDVSAEAMGDDSIYTWITGLVCDARDSFVAHEWNAYGLPVPEHADRCAQVAETANARVILEGMDPFFYSFHSSNKDGSIESGLLTVRQMALLSGMEEMSIRAAANPSRANQLKPIKTESGTRFDIKIAKEWLLLKKRYIPISRRWSEGELDLAQKRFANFVEMEVGLNARYKMLCNQASREALDARLQDYGIKTSEAFAGPFMDIPEDEYANEEKLKGVAKVLELPENLLVLRVKEVLALETLRGIERQLREISQQ